MQGGTHKAVWNGRWETWRRRDRLMLLAYGGPTPAVRIAN